MSLKGPFNKHVLHLSNAISGAGTAITTLIIPFRVQLVGVALTTAAVYTAAVTGGFLVQYEITRGDQNAIRGVQGVARIDPSLLAVFNCYIQNPVANSPHLPDRNLYQPLPAIDMSPGEPLLFSIIGTSNVQVSAEVLVYCVEV
jgi:hypothetical protein